MPRSTDAHLVILFNSVTVYDKLQRPRDLSKEKRFTRTAQYMNMRTQ